MIRYVLAVAALAAMLSPGEARADAACEEAGSKTMNACAADDLRNAEASLSQTYETLMARVGPRTKQALRDAQQAWETFRQKSCDLASLGADGGSAQRYVFLTCASGLTAERRKALAFYLTCEEGDLACIGRGSP